MFKRKFVGLREKEQREMVYLNNIYNYGLDILKVQYSYLRNLREKEQREMVYLNNIFNYGLDILKVKYTYLRNLREKELREKRRAKSQNLLDNNFEIERIKKMHVTFFNYFRSFDIKKQQRILCEIFAPFA